MSLFFFIHFDDDRGLILPLLKACEGLLDLKSISLPEGFSSRTTYGMAAKIARYLQEFQARGPYQLLSYRASYWIAHEVAAILIGQNQDVSFLGVIDPIQSQLDGGLSANSNGSSVPAGQASATLWSRPNAGCGDAIYTESYIPSYSPVRPYEVLISFPAQQDIVKSEIILLSKVASKHLAMFERSPSALNHLYGGLIPMHRGNESGDQVFCVPGAGASITSFIELISRLKRSSSVLGIQPRGMEGSTVPYTTVEAAATAYSRCILSSAVGRAVHLIGHSFGGWIAFQMATLLEKEGFIVESLSILDSMPPDSDPKYLREATSREVSIRWIELAELMLGYKISYSEEDFDLTDEMSQCRTLHAILASEGKLWKKMLPEQFIGPLRTFSVAQRTTFIPECQFLGRVNLVLAENPDLTSRQNYMRIEAIRNGWKKWAPNVVCQIAPGNHVTLLREPNVSTLAAMIGL